MLCSHLLAKPARSLLPKSRTLLILCRGQARPEAMSWSGYHLGR